VALLVDVFVLVGASAACGGSVQPSGASHDGGADSGRLDAGVDSGLGDSAGQPDADAGAARDTGPVDSSIGMDASGDAASIDSSIDSASTIAPMCSTAAGAFPPSNCDDSAQMCPTIGSCPLHCTESTAPGACEPLADNTGKATLDFRMRALNIAGPPALANLTVQGSVITPSISLSPTQAPGCAESGSGTFNWLLSVDKTGGTLTTGGAPPSAAPFSTGYCFYDGTADGIAIAPVSAPVTFTGSTFTSSPLASVLNIPIFVDTLADPIILPIRAAVFHDVTVSADSNCIGTFNPTALDNQCHDDPTTCSKWHTSGAVAGYMTLVDADSVNVSLLGESLCVLLTGTGSTKTAAGKCPANAFTMGNYCSVPPGPGGCGDSFWLAATFAASAVTITSGTGVPGCM
jgi:hypothetical protein